MIEHQDIDRFKTILDAARALGPKALESLESWVAYLDSYANGPGCSYEKEGTKCVIGYDSAPLSFGFSMFRGDGNGGWVYWYSGGLTYHGQGSNAMSIELNGSNEPHWSMHT